MFVGRAEHLGGLLTCLPVLEPHGLPASVTSLKSRQLSRQKKLDMRQVCLSVLYSFARAAITKYTD